MTTLQYNTSIKDYIYKFQDMYMMVEDMDNAEAEFTNLYMA